MIKYLNKINNIKLYGSYPWFNKQYQYFSIITDMIKTIIFDWKRTLYNPDSKSLMEGVIELLSTLRNKKSKLILIGKGGDEMHFEVDRLNIKKYFSEIIFHEGTKNVSTYRQFLSSEPKQTIFVGDRVRSELMVGNKLGAITIWLKQGKFAEENPLDDIQVPTYTVISIQELKNLLDKFQ